MRRSRKSKTPNSKLTMFTMYNDVIMINPATKMKKAVEDFIASASLVLLFAIPYVLLILSQ